MKMPDATDQLLKAAVAECAQYERMLAATRKANANWSDRYYRLLGDYQRLIYSALSINDRLRVHADHAEFTGSMADAEDFCELVNELHWKHADEFTDDVLERDEEQELF